MPRWEVLVSVPDSGNRIPNTEGRKGCSALKQISYSEFCIRYSVFALLIALCSLLSFPAQATIRPALTCDAANVQNAMNTAQAGDTVSIPAGTCTWTMGVSWTAPANVTLQGAGSQTATGGGDVTTIIDSFASSNALLAIATGPSGTFRITGLTFQGGSTGTGNDKYDGMIHLSGSSANIRVDHIHQKSTTYSPGTNGALLEFTGCVYGVVDHSIFDNPAGSVNNAIRVFNQSTCNSDALGVGDQAFAAPTGLGTSKFIFAEDNVFNSGASNDCYDGGTFVWRHNTFNMTAPAPAIQTHPTAGVRHRGCRAWEIYGNTFNANPGNYIAAAFFVSAMTGVIWGNTLTSSSAGGGTGFANLVTGHDMRYDASTYAEGATPSGWGYCGTHFNGTSSAWDQNTNTSTGYPCLDQLGRGQGQLIVLDFPNAKNNVTGTIAWPNQALEPIYEWADAYSPVPSNPSHIWSQSDPEALINRDYYLGTTDAGTPISFTGTTGVGSGLFSARPSACTPGVAYWATDQNTLYQCSAANNWAPYYTPYTYPHPLVSGTTQTTGPAWSGIIDPSRGVDWSQAGVVGGIPNRTTVCSTLNPGAPAAQIQSALNACPSGEVVFLNPGNYSLSGGITVPSNVTLRGAGGGKTNITFTGASNYYWGSYLMGFVGGFTGGFEGSPPGPSGSNNCSGSVGPPSSYTGCTQLRSWTGTNGSNGVYTKGATVLNLASPPTGLNVGDTIQLVGTNDIPPAGNGPIVCQDVGCSREGDGSNTRETALRQNAKVTAISGSQITIFPALYTDLWNSSKNPVAYWWSNPTTMAGIENMTITSNVSGGTWAGLLFYESGDCWISGVALHVNNGTRSGFLIHMSRNATIQNNWLDQMAGGGYSSTTSYGIVPFGSTGNLIENNILYNVESPIITQVGSAGDVYAYNYNPDVCTAPNGCTGIVAGHDAGGGMDLFEGNIGPQIRPDTFHGTNPFWTIFRNYLDASNGAAIDLWSYSRYYNIIGNVLGKNGTSTNYECENSAAAGCDRYGPNIFRLGYPGAGATTGIEANVSPDAQVKTTLMRWGNYDTVNNAVRFVSAEVPSGISPYANAVPLNQTLPSSFYLAAQPPWWTTSFGTPAWPAIGPLVSGGNIAGVAGHANKIPAQLCYENTASYSTFNAAACYGSAPTVSPCDTNGDGSTNVLDVQQEVNMALGITACTADINKDSFCNIIDVQRVVNAALGGQCVSP